MKYLKETMQRSSSLRSFTIEEMDVWCSAYQKLQKDIASKKGVDSFLPLSFIAELGELITVLSESIGRPDKNISIWEILDEMADVAGFFYYVMNYYGISMETLRKAMTIKIIRGARNYNIPLADMIKAEKRKSCEVKECDIEGLWNAYLDAINN